MSEIIPQDTSPRQDPTGDRVLVQIARHRGITVPAAKAWVRKVGADHEWLIRMYSRLGAMNRIERLTVRNTLAARPTGTLDCSDPAHEESITLVEEKAQRADVARFYTALDGPLPVEEETELRANYALMAAVRARCEVLEARREARR